MCINGAWRAICRDFFDDDDAVVACRQLGYSPIGMLVIYFGDSAMYILNMSQNEQIFVHAISA